MKEPIWTVLGVLQWTADFLGRKGALSPRLDAELLLAHALSLERIQLYVQYDRPLTLDERDRFRALVRRRAAGEPAQYILGRQEFWSLDLRVEPGVLIPRADTEVLVDEALAAARAIVAARGAAVEQGLRVADVGTGSGAVALALASELEGARVWAGDVDATAVRVARDNARRVGLSERVAVAGADALRGLWEAAGREPFDLVVSNPPYIPDGEHAGLMREVRDWEPRRALTSGADGLDMVRRLVEEARGGGVVASGGAIALEIGSAEQASMARDLLVGAGWQAVRIREDLAGRARVVVGTGWPG